MLTTRPPATNQHRLQHTYQVLTTMVTLGPGPHSMKTIAEHSGLAREVIGEELAAMQDAGVCVGSGDRLMSYELTGPAARVASGWLLHALPDVDTTLQLKEELRALHESTGQAVLMHGHTMLPPIRLCLDYFVGQRHDFLQQLSANPEAAAALRRAPLADDAPGLAIMAHLATTPPGSPQLRRIRQNGYATSASPLPGWSLLSVPILSTPELGMWELTGSAVAGAVTLAVPTPDLGPSNLTHWLNELQHTALYLAPSYHDYAAPSAPRHAA